MGTCTRWLGFIGLAACQAQLGVPAGTAIACTAATQCPKSLICAPTTHRCVAVGSDTSPPTVASAAATDANTIAVTFDEPLDAASASTVANFSVTGDGPAGPVVIHGATLDSTGLLVTLFIDETWPGAAYSVSAAHVSDRAGNVSDDNGTATFIGYGTVDVTLPTLLSPTNGALVSLLATGATSPGVPPAYLPAPEDAQPVTLSWTARVGARAYIVQMATAPDFSAFGDTPAPLTLTVDRSATSLSFPDAAIGAPALEPLTYYWRVRADGASPAFDAQTPFNTFDALAGVVYVYCPGGVTCSDGGRVGNKSKPAQTIGGGIGIAVANGRGRVHVSGRGDGAVYNEVVNLTNAVSLYGGYAANGEDRDIPAFPAIIQSNAFTQVVAVSITSGPTVFDGFTVDGGTSSVRGDSKGIVITDCTEALTISNCTISAGVSSLAADVCQSAVGLQVYGAVSPPEHSPLITGNRVATPTCANRYSSTVAAGLAVNNTSPRVFGNIFTASTLDGNSGSSQLRTMGATFTNSNAVVVGNTITGGDTIEHGSGAGISIGLSSDGGPLVVGNVIISGAARESIGFAYVGATGADLIADNTIVVAGGTVYAYGIDTPTGATLEGNIFATAVSGAVAIHSGDSTLPLSANHNAFAGFSNLFGSPSCNATTTSALDNCVGDAPAANQLLAPNTISSFGFAACVSGSSNYCLSDATASPVLTGGVDLSGAACPLGAPAACGFTTNRDGTARGTTIGAY